MELRGVQEGRYNAVQYVMSRLIKPSIIIIHKIIFKICVGAGNHKGLPHLGLVAL